jgi:hypothetical protein
LAEKSESGDIPADKLNDPGLLGWGEVLIQVLKFWLVWNRGNSSISAEIEGRSPVPSPLLILLKPHKIKVLIRVHCWRTRRGII